MVSLIKDCRDLKLNAIMALSLILTFRDLMHQFERPCSKDCRKDSLLIGLDDSLMNSHSEKDGARRTWKKSFGFHPLCSYLDHGAFGTGEPLVTLLRPGNASSITVADHIQVVKDSIKQLRRGCRSGPEDHDPPRLRRCHGRVPGLAYRQTPQLLLPRRIHDQ